VVPLHPVVAKTLYFASEDEACIDFSVSGFGAFGVNAF